MKDLIIFGNSSFAEIACYYFADGKEYNVVGFCVDDEFYENDNILGYPVYRYSNFITKYEATKFSIFVAVTYHKLNIHRQDILKRCMVDGFYPASYLSPDAYVHHSLEIGYHNFIFENNVIQPGCFIGNNNIFWSGNHIGHHSTFCDNNFISSHCVFSGHISVENNCFFGVNSTLSNNIKINSFVWAEPTSCIQKNIERGSIIKSQVSEISKVTSFKLFKISDD